MISIKLNDNQYPNNGVDHTRKVTRAILLNDKNEVCLLKIFGNDIFGVRDYFETPGGGVDENETFEEALVRELDEEVGVSSSIIMFLGEVVDYYNLIKRKNINHYYLCKIDSYTRIHHESSGDDLIQSINFYPLEDAIKLYENMSNFGVSFLVKQRELPILKELQRMINEKLIQL